MSALDSLIRLHRWQLDERRRQLADLDMLAEKLHREEARLAAEQEAEQGVASRSQEAATAYPDYARNLIDRRQRIEQSLVSVAEQIVAAREALSDAYREVKRYEIAAASRMQQLRRRGAREQQRALDEIGIETFRRRRGAL
jgi:flagellar protein FliJ